MTRFFGFLAILASLNFAPFNVFAQGMESNMPALDEMEQPKDAMADTKKDEPAKSKEKAMPELPVDDISIGGDSTNVAGETAPRITMKSSDTKDYSLSDYLGKIVVLEWYNSKCPMANLRYDKKLIQEKQSKYKEKGIEWFTVISAAEGMLGYVNQENAEQIKVERGIMSNALLIDEDGSLARELRIETIPTVAVVNPAGNIVYSGAINEISQHRDEAGVLVVEEKEDYVSQVLDALLAKQPTPIVYKEPVGCKIKR